VIARRFLLGALLFLAACDGAGQVASNEEPPSPALWEIETASGQRGWVFGTIHSLPGGQAWRTARLDGALGDAQLLVLEVAELDDAAAMRATYAQLATTPGLAAPSARVTPSEAPAVRAALARAGLEEADLTSLETWAVALSLSNAAGPPGESVDRQLLAEWGERPLAGLETIAGQLGIFDTLAPEEQAELLVSVVEETREADERQALADAWRNGDIVALEALTRQGMLARPALREALLDRRNHAWAARIVPLLAAGRAPFVAVGAGHVVGAQGLPALLAARGLAVRRLQ